MIGIHTHTRAHTRTHVCCRPTLFYFAVFFFYIFRRQLNYNTLTRYANARACVHMCAHPHRICLIGLIIISVWPPPPGPGGLVPFIDINLGRRWVLLKIAQARARKRRRIASGQMPTDLPGNGGMAHVPKCTMHIVYGRAARGAEGGASGSAVIFISHTHFASILGVLSGYLYASMRKLIADTFYANMADVVQHACCPACRAIPNARRWRRRRRRVRACVSTLTDVLSNACARSVQSRT